MGGEAEEESGASEGRKAREREHARDKGGQPLLVSLSGHLLRRRLHIAFVDSPCVGLFFFFVGLRGRGSTQGLHEGAVCSSRSDSVVCEGAPGEETLAASSWQHP